MKIIFLTVLKSQPSNRIRDVTNTELTGLLKPVSKISSIKIPLFTSDYTVTLFHSLFKWSTVTEDHASRFP